MDNNKIYHSCNVPGRGKVNLLSSGRKIPFRLVDMSAGGIKIKLEEHVDVAQKVFLNIVLEFGPIEVKVDTDGFLKSISSFREGFECEIELVNLSEEDREEINELMMSSCAV